MEGNATRMTVDDRRTMAGRKVFLTVHMCISFQTNFSFRTIVIDSDTEIPLASQAWLACHI